jgi:enoyl-CoA hydratase
LAGLTKQTRGRTIPAAENYDMDSKTFHFESQNGTGIITLSRPEVLNALNIQLFADLNKLLDELEKDPVILIITGTGKGFAAGADIKEMADMSPDEALKLSVGGQKTFQRLEDYPFPVIAAVNGYALGGGCELCMACDIRLASKEAKFGQPEVKLGLIPGYGATHKLAKHVGLGNALYMLTTALNIGAKEALQMGLVQEICEPEALLDRAKEVAGIMGKAGSDSLQAVKSVCMASSDLSYDIGLKLESGNFMKMFEGQGKEGMKAFVEKRKPEW